MYSFQQIAVLDRSCEVLYTTSGLWGRLDCLQSPVCVFDFVFVDTSNIYRKRIPLGKVATGQYAF